MGRTTPKIEAPSVSREAIDEFCDSLWLEDGLSKNTLDAYRRDMTLYAHWLYQERAKALYETQAEDSQRLFRGAPR